MLVELALSQLLDELGDILDLHKVAYLCFLHVGLAEFLGEREVFHCGLQLLQHSLFGDVFVVFVERVVVDVEPVEELHILVQAAERLLLEVEVDQVFLVDSDHQSQHFLQSEEKSFQEEKALIHLD